jgi:hypothetical protein
MPPSFLYGIMHWQIHITALTAGKSAPTPEVHVYMKLAFLTIKHNFFNVYRVFYPQSHAEQFFFH